MTCSYYDDSTGKFKWEIHKANTESNEEFKPPDTDHTTSSDSGHYIMVDHSDNIFGETSILKGPILGHTKELCLFRFWYHIEGDQEQQYRSDQMM